jgi:hypothetical protein
MSHHHRLPSHLVVLHSLQPQRKPSFRKQFTIILIVEALVALLFLLLMSRHMGSAPISFVSHY